MSRLDRAARIAAPYAVLVAASAYAALLGPLWWGLDLLAHFPAHRLLVLLPLVALLAAARRRRLLLATAPALVLDAALVLPVWTARPAPAGPGRLAVTAFNVNRDNPRRAEALAFALGTGADVIVLTEIGRHWLPLFERVPAPYRLIAARPREDNFGIAALARRPVRRAEITFYTDWQIPVVDAVLDWEGRELVVLGVHPVPPAGARYARIRDEQLAALAARVRAERRPVVLAGDLNATRWSSAFRRLVRDSGLRSTQDGFGLQASWPAELGPLGIAIDHGLCSPSLTTVERRIGPAVGSDHRALTFVVGPAGR